MDKDVMIKIEGMQSVDGEESQVNELITQGKYSVTPEGFRFSYMESELTGLEGTKTSFFVMPAEVVLSRSGAVNAQMIFHKGERHTFLYDTPYGAVTMRLDTHKLSHDLDEQGGRMEIEYDIDFENAVLTRNRFIIDVKMQRGS